VSRQVAAFANIAAMFASIRVDDWETLRVLGRRLLVWAFRGQSDSTWPLLTSIERRAKAGGTPREILENRERWILRQFQRRAHLVIDSPPPESAALEWLSIIQHYGGPTRLLDFTRSIYIAAFFAIEPCWECDAAIWGINTNPLIWRDRAASSAKNLDQLNLEYARQADAIITSGSDALGVLAVEPDRLNERMSIQHGIFMFPTNVKASFAANLAAAIGVTELHLAEPASADVSVSEFLAKISKTPNAFSAAKFTLPRRAHEEAIYDLREMNITAATLFPGLEGFARSLAHHLRMPAFARYPELLKSDS